MVNRNVRVRTPRRTKAWATKSGQPPSGLGSLTTAAPQVFMDLLSDYRTDMGISNTDRVTAMRILGHIAAFDFGTSTNPTTIAIAMGIAWVPGIVASAGAGDAQIPDPAEVGAREAPWMWTDTIHAAIPNASGVILPATGNARIKYEVEFDITQMRKQPTADSKLVLIVNPTSVTNIDVGLSFYTRTMIALS